MIETMTRTEWMNRNPILKRYISSNPSGWMEATAFTLWPNSADIEGIDDHQRFEVSKSFGGRIGILGGSPGTGKTHLVAKLIAHLLERGLVADHDIGIGAPTGKAAVRLTEMLQANNIPLRARTWHSLLRIGANSQTGGWSFAHNENCPFPYRLLIGDESSMLDLSLMLAVLKARGIGCHMLIVGDVNQLPPVGSGAPLRDMIAAGLPYGELKEIKRNSGGIVEACAAIRDEKPWNQYCEPGSNLQVTGHSSQEEKVEVILGRVFESEAEGFDPVWDCQVLVAVNESSPLSRKALNTRLQEELNPGQKFEGTVFRPKDKIVCLKNGFYKSMEQVVDEDVRKNDRDEVYVANGELAEVVRIDGVEVIAELESPARVVSIPIRKSNGTNQPEAGGGISNWDLGYALSVHKSQGSEWPVVVVALDSYPGAKMICSREWIYTSISRGKKHVHLVGPFELANRFCRVAKITQRKTFLKERIQSELFKREAEEEL